MYFFIDLHLIFYKKNKLWTFNVHFLLIYKCFKKSFIYGITNSWRQIFVKDFYIFIVQKYSTIYLFQDSIQIFHYL